MDALDEYKDDPERWIFGLLEETARVNKLQLTPSLAMKFLRDNWDFIQACFEEEAIELPKHAKVEEAVQRWLSD